MQHMKTLVYVHGFLQIKYSLYIIDNVLLQRYLFFVDYNVVLISKHPCWETMHEHAIATEKPSKNNARFFIIIICKVAIIILCLG